MDDRHRQVLIAIIREYVDSAEPVGSRALARRHMPNLSPATIRNVMADLEEMGYLSQPHASAGRVPTDKAYRFYVDSFPPPSPSAAPPASADRADRTGIDQLMEQTAASLSESSHFTGVLLAPPLRHTVLGRVELLPLEEDRVLALIITDTGWVTARALTAPPNLTREEIREIGREITARVRGRSVQQVLAAVPSRAAALDPLRVRAGGLLDQIMGILQERTLYVSGATNMLDHPEFLDIGAMRQMLRTFEEKDRLIELLTGLVGWGQGVRVTIGEENPVEELQECTLVTSAYSYRDQVVGVLGIVGPRRMPYPQVMSIVRDTAERISERLARARRDLYLPS